MIPLRDVVDGIGCDDAVEGWQREATGDVGLKEPKLGTGKVALHGCAQGLQAGRVAINGDDRRVWARDVTERKRERAAASAEIGPNAATVPLDSALDQPHVIVVVHQTTPPRGVDTGWTTL